MSFSVKIIDNKNGEVLVDEMDVRVILGSITTRGCVQGLGAMAECSPMVLYHAVGAAQKVLASITEDHPELSSIGKLLDLAKDLSDVTDALSELKKDFESEGNPKN